MFSQDRIAKLINLLEHLTHNDRISEIVKLGRREKEDREVVTAIDNLEKGNHYERLLALYSCYGSYNGERVIRAIKDNSRSIRNKAIELIALVGNDTQVLEALDILNFKQRRYLLKYLRTRKRLTVIDRFLTRLIDREEERIDRLLIYGTSEIINLHLDKILERAGIDEWSNLARLHPQIAIAALRDYAAKSIGKDWRFVWHFDTTILRIAELDRDSALSLIQSLVNHPSFSNLSFQELVYYHPLEVAKLVLQSEDNIRINFNSVSHKLPQDILIDLIQKQPHTINNYTHWLPKLKPERRTAIYEYCHRGWRNKDGCLSIDLIKLFPAAIREKEARYHLELPSLT